MHIVSHTLGAIPAVSPRDARWDPALLPAIVDSPVSRAARQRLVTPGALVVTTGQQPGLFTGPLYTVHKALAAAALARRLQDKWQRPVVALLWVAGDDHDWAEASNAAWLNTQGGISRWRLPERAATAPQLPMYREPVPGEAEDGLRVLEASLPVGPARDQTLEWLRRHYRTDATLQTAAAGALAELLASHDVLVFDPTHPVMKRSQSVLIGAALRKAAELDRLLGALPPLAGGVSVGDGTSLVFLETTAGRERLVIDGDGFRTRRSGEVFTLAQLEQMLATAPERFSPNALLRPVIEAALLPTVGYVGGPGELRYLSRQASALYAPLGVWQQPAIPRWSGTVIEPWADRLLKRLDISLDQLLADDDGSLGKSILLRDMPPAITGALANLRTRIDAEAAPLHDAGTAIDPVLERAIDGRLRKLGGVLADLESLIARHLRKRDDISWSQYRRLRSGLRPDDVPQERVFTAATFLSRHGDDWLKALTASADSWAKSA